MGSLIRSLVPSERGRQILLFIFCLFLAFIIWHVHKLSDSYTHSFQFKVTAKSAQPVSYQLESASNLVIRGRASGFYILQQRYSKKVPVINLNAQLRQMRIVREREERYYILPEEIKGLITESIGSKIQLESVVTDTLRFVIKR